MATIKISRAKSATAALNYAKGKDKLADKDKQWLTDHGAPFTDVDDLHDRAVVESGVLLNMDYPAAEMSRTRGLFNNAGSTEAMRIIQSFSTSDLNPTNPEDWQLANDLGRTLAERIAPNHEVAIYTHLDGIGHKLHNHIIINMPDLDTGKKYHHNNDWQRVANISNQISLEHGLSVIKAPRTLTERRTMAERNLQRKGQYVWKDDLRHRIETVTADPSITSYQSFKQHLAKQGVIAHDRGQNVSYAFLDANKKHRRARGTSLGKNYEKESLINFINSTQLLHSLQREHSTEQPTIIQSSSEPAKRFRLAKERSNQPQMISKTKTLERQLNPVDLLLSLQHQSQVIDQERKAELERLAKQQEEEADYEKSNDIDHDDIEIER